MKKPYVSPIAKNIISFSSTGQTVSTRGFCEDGSNPIVGWCSPGITPTQNVSACAPTGNVAARGGCNLGNSAAEGCTVGSSVQQPSCLPTGNNVLPPI